MTYVVIDQYKYWWGNLDIDQDKFWWRNLDEDVFFENDVFGVNMSIVFLIYSLSNILHTRSKKSNKNKTKWQTLYL